MCSPGRPPPPHLPLCSPFFWVDSDGAGLVQALGDDHVAEGAVESGHLNHIKALVSPVDVPYGGTEHQHNIQQQYKPVTLLRQCILNNQHALQYNNINGINHKSLTDKVVLWKVTIFWDE